MVKRNCAGSRKQPEDRVPRIARSGRDRQAGGAGMLSADSRNALIGADDRGDEDRFSPSVGAAIALELFCEASLERAVAASQYFTFAQSVAERQVPAQFIRSRSKHVKMMERLARRTTKSMAASDAQVSFVRGPDSGGQVRESMRP